MKFPIRIGPRESVRGNDVSIINIMESVRSNGFGDGSCLLILEKWEEISSPSLIERRNYSSEFI